jgi:hypothetical protein
MKSVGRVGNTEFTGHCADSFARGTSRILAGGVSRISVPARDVPNPGESLLDRLINISVFAGTFRDSCRVIDSGDADY